MNKKELNKMDNDARLLIIVGMWAEAVTHAPKADLQNKLVSILKNVKIRDPLKYKGIRAFLYQRGIEVKKL